MCGIFCGAARADDGGGGRQDAGAEMGLAQELPEGLDGAQPGKRRRRLAQKDSAWDTRLFACLGPSGSIEEQVFDKLGRRDCLASLATDLFVRQVYGLGVAIRQDHGRADIAARPPSAAYGGPFAAQTARGGEPAAARGPDAGQRALPTNPGGMSQRFQSCKSLNLIHRSLSDYLNSRCESFVTPWFSTQANRAVAVLLVPHFLWPASALNAATTVKNH
jgi:hypothetical protein